LVERLWSAYVLSPRSACFPVLPSDVRGLVQVQALQGWRAPRPPCRSAFTVSGITVKIGAIERRSNFVERGKQGDYIGIELGADTSASVDIDDYLTFEDDRKEVQDFFSNLLFNHAKQLMAEEGDDPGFPSAQEFIRIAFSAPPGRSHRPRPAGSSGQR
jgi:hypothetical protein